jgi:hypothetical protein
MKALVYHGPDEKSWIDVLIRRSRIRQAYDEA